MKVRIELIDETREEEVVIRVHEKNEAVVAMTRRIESVSDELSVQKGNTFCKIKLDDIFYFEIVDRKAFIYVQDEVYETKLKLYEFEEKTRGNGFFRASKSMILNADKIDYVKPSLSGRFEVRLLNGETVLVSRQYAKLLRRMMEM